MPIVDVSKGFQITIPAKIRKKYDIKIGTKLDLEEEADEIVLRPMKKPELEELFAAADKLPRNNYTPEELDRVAEKELFGE